MSEKWEQVHVQAVAVAAAGMWKRLTSVNTSDMPCVDCLPFEYSVMRASCARSRTQLRAASRVSSARARTSSTGGRLSPAPVVSVREHQDVHTKHTAY